MTRCEKQTGYCNTSRIARAGSPYYHKALPKGNGHWDIDSIGAVWTGPPVRSCSLCKETSPSCEHLAKSELGIQYPNLIHLPAVHILAVSSLSKLRKPNKQTTHASLLGPIERCLHTQLLSHVWLCDPMDCSPPGFLVHGIFQARVLEWVAISFSRRIFLTQGSNLCLLLGRQILYYWASWEALNDKEGFWRTNMAYLAQKVLS